MTSHRRPQLHHCSGVLIANLREAHPIRSNVNRYACHRCHILIFARFRFTGEGLTHPVIHLRQPCGYIMCSQTNRVTSKTASQPDPKRRSTEWLFPGPAHELLYGSPQTRPSEFVKTRDYNWGNTICYPLCEKGDYRRGRKKRPVQHKSTSGTRGSLFEKEPTPRETEAHTNQPTKPTGAQEYAGEGDPVDQRRSRLKVRISIRMSLLLNWATGSERITTISLSL